ncbi:hypothetical protein ACKKBG_A23770 [Auxenochlorella protothecoides x Auxenochlorella symbiontica]
MDPTQGFVTEFAGFVDDLTTPEKRNIVALTEIAREAMHNQPQAVPGLAQVIINRVLHADQPLKLPALYLLDSISKLVGEPYKTYFSAALPEVFAVAWRGGETARPALQKLLGTWRGVFADHVLAMAQAEMQYQDHVQYHRPQGAQTAPHYPAWAAPQQYQGAHGAAQYAAPLPAAAAPQYPPVTQPRYSHQPAPAAQHQHYAAPAPLVPRYKTPPPGMCHPTPRPGSGPTVPLPDLLSSLLAAGVLGGAKAAGVAEAREPSLEFSSEIIKGDASHAVHRLLARTAETKSAFLDVQFLRRARRGGGALRASRLWYVDLDVWLASAAGAGQGAAAGEGQPPQRGDRQPDARVASAAAQQRHSVPVDEDQPACALSGEAFEQVWDEEHQEWRYEGAVRLTGDQALRYGLSPGAIVLFSALGEDGLDGPAEALPAAAAPGAAAKKEDGDEGQLRAKEEGQGSGTKREKPTSTDSPPPDIKRIKLEG